jgi:hypothetical protein
MAVVSMFYGIIISLYFFDNQQHNTPHLHAKYQNQEAVFSLIDGNIIAGKLKQSKIRLVQAWIEIHKEELIANWELAVNGREIFKIDPLK